MTTPSHNALSHASSSYLRSAMHQPVQWQEWGEEAFALARRENKPMLLDIGAVWCHWCHVMDRESYDDPEVAAIVNENFVAVKVDRDERPDIDSRYQAAVGALTGQGGWPLTAFLTPDGKPFYGGTYFPPDDRYGRPSFKRVLLAIANSYREKQGEVQEQAKMVASAVAQGESFAGRGGEVSARVIATIVEAAVGQFDPRNGGFGTAPKFPHPSALDLLMDEHARTERAVDGAGFPPFRTERERMRQPSNDDAHNKTGENNVRNVFVTTLEKMAMGGVYDQLAGGFHRYSVDERWVVPHFEKMCYDNSELLKNYVHAYQATGDEFFATVARDIIRWMDEWLSDRARGGFYASQDADYSMDDDGDYFTWTLDEARAALTEEEAAVAELHYDIGEIGEMHHNPAKNVLSVRVDVDEIARRLGLSEERVRELLASAKKKMLAARVGRPTPYVDKTVYVGWNAMCVSAYLEAARVLELREARVFALRSLDRVLAEGWGGGSALRHVIAYSDPQATRRETAGVLDDYAFTVIACLDAYEATSDLSYFRFAQQIADTMLGRFFDPVAGGFFDTEGAEAGKSAEESGALGILGTRRKPFQDSPTPAGNSAAAIGLLRLHAYTNKVAYRDAAEQTLEAFAGVADKFGMFAATYGLAVMHFTQMHMQVVVVGQDRVAEELCREAVRPLALNKAVLRLDASEVVAQNLPPALAETLPNLPALQEGRSFAVVCSGFACQPPVFEAEELGRRLGMAARPAA